MDYRARIQRLQSTLAEQDGAPLLVTNLTNVRYLTGFSGSNGQLLVTPDEAVFFTDGRYRAQASDRVDAASIEIYLTRLADVLTPVLDHKRITRLGIEGTTMTLFERDDLAGRIGAELVTTSGVVERLRRTKEPAEIDAMRAAIALGDATFEWVLDRIEPGRLEREVALELEVHMRSNGAEAVSFEPIVGSGPLSAHIHHTPGARALEKGDLVLMDFGCVIDGYCSDLTRTVLLGPAAEEHERLFSTVLEAQRAAYGAMTPGTPCRDVDAAARGIIEGAGHGDDFGHGLGHGLGLEVHEQPRFSRISEDTVQAGDVMTNEPGIYVGDFGGIRIEDCVWITETGPEPLTAAPKDRLIEL
jgi:Xaa-Pro aminopeptidase